MYTQKDINEFAYFITLYVFDKAYKKYHGPCDITDSMINDSFEENSLLIAVCNNGSYESYTGFFGKTRIGYMIDSIHKEDKNTFYKTINAVYDINLLFKIGLTHQYIQRCIEDLPIPQEVFDDVFSYSAEVETVITPQQLEYVESLEWDCDYWDSLDVKVIDSLDPEVRELCFEYYDSMLPEVLDPVEDMMLTMSLQLAGAEMDAELESMFEFGIDAVMSYEQLDMLGVETLTSHEVDEMLNTVESITVKVEPVRDDVKLPEPVEAVVEPVSSDDNLQLFANHYSLIVWSSITKHHNFDVLDSEDEYANKYEETILHEYYQDDKPYRAKDFHEFCISCPEANNIINKYIDINKLWQMGHTDEYVIEIASYFFENYDIPSEKEAYHKYAPHLIPVRDDVKLLPPVEVIPEPVEVIPEPVEVVPQEVVSEPQEDIVSSTTTNEDTMNNNTFVESVSNDAELVKFSEFYALCVYYHTMKHLHNIDVWANGDAHKVYASQYSKAILYHYGYDDDEYLVDTSFEKDFSNVVKQLVHDPYDLWVIAHMTSKLVNDYRDELNEALWYNPYKTQLTENYTKYVPVPSSNSQYVIACDVEVVEPVRDDVKLPLPVEVIVPQEVVSEPQEDCLSTTTLNEDKTMSIILPDFSTNGNTFTLVPVEFTSIWYEVPTVDVVELTGQYSEFACHISDGWIGECSDVLEGWVGKVSHLTSHISDGWYGQCCDLAERPLSTEEREAVEHKVEQFANGVKAHVKSYKRELRPTQEIETLARIKELVEQSQVPTITTKSGKVVPVSPHAVTPHGNAPVSSRVTSPKVTSAIGEASAIDPVSEFKSTLFNLDNFDVVKQATQDLLDMFSPDEYNTLRDKYGVDVMKKAFNTLQGDIRTRIRSMINEANTIRNGIELTVVATQAPKATVAPKVSTATFASNFNSLVIAKYRELNNGIIKDSLVLNKLTSALRANNVEAYTNLVTTFNNPVAVSLHRQAYDAVVSAS